MGLKEAFLQKGWAGRTISRAETIERLNPVLEQLLGLMHAYQYVIDHIGDPALAERLEALQKTLRADAGKLSETILSCGGVSYTGVDLESDQFNLGDTDEAMLFNVLDQEQAFQAMIGEEKDVEHQIRTRAILGVVAQNSDERLTFLKEHTRHRRRPTPAV